MCMTAGPLVEPIVPSISGDIDHDVMHRMEVTLRSQMGVGVSWQVGTDHTLPSSTASLDPVERRPKRQDKFRHKNHTPASVSAQ